MLKKFIYPLFLLGVAYILISSEDAKTIIAGIAIFLIGMVFMEDGFKLFSGGLLEKVLEKSTKTVNFVLIFGSSLIKKLCRYKCIKIFI